MYEKDVRAALEAAAPRLLGQAPKSLGGVGRIKQQSLPRGEGTNQGEVFRLVAAVAWAHVIVEQRDGHRRGVQLRAVLARPQLEQVADALLQDVAARGHVDADDLDVRHVALRAE